MKPKNKTKLGLLSAAAVLASAPLASAQATNEGVVEVIAEVGALAPDMGDVVIAGVGFAFIGIGAIAAFALVKRLMRG